MCGQAPSVSWRSQVRLDSLELIKGGAKVFSDLGGDDIRIGEVGRAGPSLGRRDERERTRSWWRRARFSNTSSRRMHRALYNAEQKSRR